MATAADSQNQYESIDKEITQINTSLSRCKLRRDKSSLALRGQFPPKPKDKDQTKKKRQHLYLGLQATTLTGIPGLRRKINRLRALENGSNN